MQEQKKIVHDSVHGSIALDGIFLDLIETAEFQRLHDIKQLGLAYLVFPGAHHTRLEHSLGTFHVARTMCDALQLDPEERTVIECAALLHDIGHAPFSHTLEWLLKDRFGLTHDDLARRVIGGHEAMIPEEDLESMGDVSTVAAVLERYGVEPKKVSELIVREEIRLHPEQSVLDAPERGHFSGLRYPSQIIHGPIDCDQVDYLIRDSHYTGVAHGVIDLDRLLNTLRVKSGGLVLEPGGISAVEGMLVARALMYTSVYFHKTVRIAELMLAKAVERLERSEIDGARRQNDSGLIAQLRGRDEFSRRIVTSLKYRRLYKVALLMRLSELGERDKELINRLCNYEEKSSVEEDICGRAGVPSGSVIIDVSGEEILTTEPRMSSVNIGVLDGGRVRPLSRISPLANSLQLRKVQDWALMVACPQKIREEVRKAAARVLSG